MKLETRYAEGGEGHVDATVEGCLKEPEGFLDAPVEDRIQGRFNRAF